MSPIDTAIPAANRQSSPTRSSTRSGRTADGTSCLGSPGRVDAAGAASARAGPRRAQVREHGEQKELVPGPVDSRASAPQKQPNVVSNSPTANLIVFSGTRARGRARQHLRRRRRRVPPRRRPRRARWPCALPNEMTMKTTSSPSSRTPLNETVNAYQSSPALCSSPAAAACSRSPEGLVLVVQRPCSRSSAGSPSAATAIRTRAAARRRQGEASIGITLQRRPEQDDEREHTRRGARRR